MNYLAFIAVIVVSSISLIGVLTLAIRKEIISKISSVFVALSVGALFGDVFIHILPEAFEKIENSNLIAVGILSGILVFFILEKILHWRHCHVTDDKNHIHPIAVLNLVGDGLHNFIDGLLIGVSFLVDPWIGLTTTIAIVLHEIPQEIGDFGVLIHNGVSVKKALMTNFVSSLFAVLGVFIVTFISADLVFVNSYLLTFTAGGFIYIAGSDLIPELKHTTKAKNSIIQFIFILIGILTMAFLTLFE